MQSDRHCAQLQRIARRDTWRRQRLWRLGFCADGGCRSIGRGRYRSARSLALRGCGRRRCCRLRRSIRIGNPRAFRRRERCRRWRVDRSRIWRRFWVPFENRAGQSRGRGHQPVAPRLIAQQQPSDAACDKDERNAAHGLVARIGQWTADLFTGQNIECRRMAMACGGRIGGPDRASVVSGHSHDPSQLQRPTTPGSLATHLPADFRRNSGGLRASDAGVHRLQLGRARGASWS